MLPAFSVHPSVPVKLSRVLQLVANKIHQDRQLSNNIKHRFCGQPACDEASNLQQEEEEDHHTVMPLATP
ncbi:unnamed protein product [Boreogadus saida]